MTATKFLTLGDAVSDEQFPAVDVALRRGRHIDREDLEWFGFLADAADVLEPFYRRFGAELVYRSDGFYYLLPAGDRLAKRQLSVAEMLVGQALTLLYLDPGTVEQGGRVTREQVLGHLATVMGTDALVRALNPKRRRYDERVAQETVRARVAEALRRLATLGFVDAIGPEEFKLRPALLRFAEPARSATDSSEALARLLASGEFALTQLDSVPERPEPDDDGADDDGADDDAAERDDGTDDDGAERDDGTDDDGAERDDGTEQDSPALESSPAAAAPAELDPDLLGDFGFEDISASVAHETEPPPDLDAERSE
jgi:chromosome partition protein MukE